MRIRNYRNDAQQDIVYVYDGDGRVVSVTTADGIVANYAYHAQNRDWLMGLSSASTGVLENNGIKQIHRLQRMRWAMCLRRTISSTKAPVRCNSSASIRSTRRNRNAGKATGNG